MLLGGTTRKEYAAHRCSMHNDYVPKMRVKKQVRGIKQKNAFQSEKCHRKENESPIKRKKSF